MAELSKDVIDTIIAEAGGDGREGMTAVAWAIANRAAKSGISPDAVVKKPHQFEGYSNPGPASRRAQESSAKRAQVKEIWQGIQDRSIPDPLQGGTMFHASSMTPYWANAENKHGTVRIGNQTYYKGGSALPPGELPSVASLTDTVPPRAVTPVTPSIDMAMMRRQTAPTNLVADSFAALPRGNPNQLGDSIGMDPIRGGKQNAPGFDAAFDTRVGAMRMLPQTEAVSSQGISFGATRAPAPIPALPTPQLAGQRATDRTLQAALDARYGAPTPAVQSVDLRQSRLPLPSASPMTRMVASTPVPPTQSLPPLSAPARPNIPQSYAGMEGSPRLPVVAQPVGSTVANKSQDRLQASAALPPALYGGVNPSVVPPQPMPRLARGPAVLPPMDMPSVATQLATTPPRVAPVPFPRPNFGMGGVDINESLTPNGVAAPTPMPRLNRGGIFGNPQIMGHDVPLPGIFGVLQGATKAMNNSSGPFNNGLDNSIYNRMRGGDFNTPLAATARSGGFLFAPNPSGGWVNVGRDPSFTSSPGHNNGNGSGIGGTGSALDRAFGEARNHN